MLYGYARVSSLDQDLSIQFDALTAAPMGQDRKRNNPGANCVEWQCSQGNGIRPHCKPSQVDHATLNFSPPLLKWARPSAGSGLTTRSRQHRSFILIVLLEGPSGRFSPHLLCLVLPQDGRHRVPDAHPQTKPVSCCVRRVRVGMGLIAASIALLVVGFALNAPGTYVIGAANIGSQTEPRGVGSIRPRNLNFAVSVGSQIPDGAGVHVPRLGTEVASETAVVQTEMASEPSAASASCAAFEARFYFDRQLASFDERFASAFVSPGNALKAHSAVTQSAPELAPVTSSPLVSVREKPLHSAEAGLSLPLDTDSRIAIYDIAARTVYLPNGHKLEAHSGLGSHLDDPRYVNTKGRGPTPPNVYNLALRERLFHGVRAIRLIPADDGKMFGRDGMLAHTYMLGPSGQSNGCVSFRNYPAFLNAFLKGEVDRLVVVEDLATATGAKTSAPSGG